jgi:hypothetical protein
MTKRTLTEKVFNFYAAPFRLLQVFLDRCQKDIQNVHESGTTFSAQMSSPHMRSYATNAQCTAIIVGVTFGAAALSVASVPASILALTAVSFASTRALKTEEEYQAKKRMEAKLTAL